MRAEGGGGVVGGGIAVLIHQYYSINTLYRNAPTSSIAVLPPLCRGAHGELSDSTRDSRELNEGLKELRGLKPLILENSGRNSGGTSPR